MASKRKIIISPISVQDIILHTTSTMIGANVLGKIIFATPGVKPLLGYEVSELIGTDLVNLIPDRLKQAHLKGFSRWVETGQLKYAQRPLRVSALHKDGREIPIKLTLGAFYDDQDMRVVATMSDVKELLELEEETQRLQQEITYVRSATKHLGEAFIAVDIHGNITLMNIAAEILIGYDEIDVVGKNAHDLFHGWRPDGHYMPKEDCIIYKTIKDGQVRKDDDDWIRRSDGTHVNIHMTTGPIYDFDRKIIGATNIIVDVTKERANQAALEASEQKYRELVELCPDPIAVHSEGHFVFANQACLELMKAKSLDDIKDKHILDFIHPDFHQFVIDRIGTKPMIGNKLELAREKGIDLEGNIIDIEVATMPIIYDNKPAIITVIRDISHLVNDNENL